MNFKKANCHTTFLGPLGYKGLVTMVFQDFITSCKERETFSGTHLSDIILYNFFIDEFLTAAILHPESSLKVYKNLASVIVRKKESKQSRNT